MWLLRGKTCEYTHKDKAQVCFSDVFHSHNLQSPVLFENSLFKRHLDTALFWINIHHMLKHYVKAKVHHLSLFETLTSGFQNVQLMLSQRFQEREFLQCVKSQIHYWLAELPRPVPSQDDKSLAIGTCIVIF